MKAAPSGTSACLPAPSRSGHGLEQSPGSQWHSPRTPFRASRIFTSSTARPAPLPGRQSTDRLWKADALHPVRAEGQLLPGGHGVITISVPLSRAGTTVSRSRASVSKPRRRWRCSQSSSSSNGSDHCGHSACTRLHGPVLGIALRWTFTPQSAQARDEIASERLTLSRPAAASQSGHLISSEPYRHDTMGSASTRTTRSRAD